MKLYMVMMVDSFLHFLTTGHTTFPGLPSLKWHGWFCLMFSNLEALGRFWTLSRLLITFLKFLNRPFFLRFPICWAVHVSQDIRKIWALHFATFLLHTPQSIFPFPASFNSQSIEASINHRVTKQIQPSKWWLKRRFQARSPVFRVVRDQKSGEVLGGFWGGGILRKGWPRHSGKAML